MNRRDKLLLYALALCVGTTTTSGAMAQQKSLKEQLIGNWTFASSIDTNKDGTKSNRWGPNAKGQLMLDPSGRFSFLISRASIPKFAVANVNQGTAEENKAVVQGMIAYIGTWSVDEAAQYSDHEYRGGVVSQSQWGHSETDHHLAHGGRTQVHQPRHHDGNKQRRRVETREVARILSSRQALPRQK
jgi:hypothetical protein